jgi:hypothetical protein
MKNKIGLLRMKTGSEFYICPLSGEVSFFRKKKMSATNYAYVESLLTSGAHTMASGIVDKTNIIVEGHSLCDNEIGGLSYLSYTISDIPLPSIFDFVSIFIRSVRDDNFLPSLSGINIDIKKYRDLKTDPEHNMDLFALICDLIDTSSLKWRYVKLQKKGTPLTYSAICLLNEDSITGVSMQCLPSQKDIKIEDCFRRVLFGTTLSKIDSSSFINFAKEDAYLVLEAASIFSENTDMEKVKKTTISKSMAIAPHTLCRISNKAKEGNPEARRKLKDCHDLYHFRECISPSIKNFQKISSSQINISDLAYIPKEVAALAEIFRVFRVFKEKRTNIRSLFVFVEDQKYDTPVIVCIGTKKENNSLYKTIKGVGAEKISLNSSSSPHVFKDSSKIGKSPVFISILSETFNSEWEREDFIHSVLSARVKSISL